MLACHRHLNGCTIVVNVGTDYFPGAVILEWAMHLDQRFARKPEFRPLTYEMQNKAEGMDQNQDLPLRKKRDLPIIILPSVPILQDGRSDHLNCCSG